MKIKTRQEHLDWCKERALECLPDDLPGAFASMISDLSKHEETKGHLANRTRRNDAILGKPRYPR